MAFKNKEEITQVTLIVMTQKIQESVLKEFLRIIKEYSEKYNCTGDRMQILKFAMRSIHSIPCLIFTEMININPKSNRNFLSNIDPFFVDIMTNVNFKAWGNVSEKWGKIPDDEFSDLLIESIEREINKKLSQ